MESLNNIIRWGMILFFILGSNQLFANNKNGQLVRSINEAVNRSDSEQDQIKTKIEKEADRRVETWADRDRDLIVIQHSGMSSMDPANLGEADLDYEEVGIDQSGLDRLRTDVEDEPIDIDFDKELREVSSVKD